MNLGVGKTDIYFGNANAIAGTKLLFQVISLYPVKRSHAVVTKKNKQAAQNSNMGLVEIMIIQIVYIKFGVLCVNDASHHHAKIIRIMEGVESPYAKHGTIFQRSKHGLLKTAIHIRQSLGNAP